MAGKIEQQVQTQDIQIDLAKSLRIVTKAFFIGELENTDVDNKGFGLIDNYHESILLHTNLHRMLFYQLYKETHNLEKFLSEQAHGPSAPRCSESPFFADTNPEAITVLASNHAGANTALSPSVLCDVKLKWIIGSIFVEPWNQYMSQCKKNSIPLELKKLSTFHFSEQSTEVTSMQVDEEPAANCKLLNELIQKETQAETKALQKEVKQLCDQLKTIQTKDSNKDDAEKAKNKQRGQACGASKKKEMAPAQTTKLNHQHNTKSSRSTSPA